MWRIKISKICTNFLNKTVKLLPILYYFAVASLVDAWIKKKYWKMRADSILSLKDRGLKDWLSTTLRTAFCHPFGVYGLKPVGEILQVERLKVAFLIDMWSCYTLPKILPKCSGFLITPQYSYVIKNLYRKTSQSEILTYYIWESWCESEVT